MCLHIRKTSVKHTVKKPMTVYKVLDGRYRSPYQHFQYRKGEAYRSPLVVDNSFYNNAPRIYTGFHSFVTMEDAIKFCTDKCDIKTNIVEMILPTGTDYYIGLFWNKLRSIASDTIMWPNKKGEAKYVPDFMR